MSYSYPFAGADHALLSEVWWKGQRIPDSDSKMWMSDKCGNVMKWPDHGNRNSEHGWEIDHIMPKARGGSDELSNLQPLNWKNNARKGDTYPWNCS